LDATFILPIFNESPFINKVISSILYQNKINQLDFEILISDGGSTDGTLEIINSLIRNHSNIYLIDNPQKIVSTGFNFALNQAKGDIIIRVDGHSEIPKNYIENCCKLLEKTNADIVGGVIETISSGLIGNAISISQSSGFGVGGVRFRNKDSKKAGYVNTLAFGAHRREIFADIGGYDEEMICNQDDEFNFRAIQAGKKIWMDPTIKTKYYSRSNFLKLFKQYFNYGCYKVRGIQKRGQVFSIRHIIPSIFIVALISTLNIGFFLQLPWITFSVVFLYLFFNLSASIYLAASLGLIPLISFAFLILHFGYGIGFIVGLFRFINKWNDTELKDFNFNREQFCANNPQ
jgi:glycosyltransferase involved in cell wall biosynthesis